MQGLNITLRSSGFSFFLLSFYFLEIDLAINATTASIAITIITPTQIPVLKISPINSQPEKITAEKIIKMESKFFISIIFLF